MHAEPVPVRFPQGSAHVFLTLSTLLGKILASGDFSQTEHHGLISSRLIYRFRDGSIDDETTTFTQKGAFHLLRDHHIQHGPSFPHSVDMLIDVPAAMITCRTPAPGGGDKVKQEHRTLPPDLSNGLALPTVMNLQPATPLTRVSLLAPQGDSARLVHVAITPAGTETFTVSGTPHKALRFVAHIELGGLTGVIAPILGKSPDDIQVWVFEGSSPAFIKLEGQMYEGGPILRTEIAAATWPKAQTP